MVFLVGFFFFYLATALRTWYKAEAEKACESLCQLEASVVRYNASRGPWDTAIQESSLFIEIRKKNVLVTLGISKITQLRAAKLFLRYVKYNYSFEMNIRKIRT